MLFAFLQRIKSKGGASASCRRCARKLRNTATCKANSEGIERNWWGKMQCCKGKGEMGTNENDENILQLCSVTLMLNRDLTTHYTVSLHTTCIIVHHSSLSPGPSSHRSDDWENHGRGCTSLWTSKLNMETFVRRRVRHTIYAYLNLYIDNYRYII